MFSGIGLRSRRRACASRFAPGIDSLESRQLLSGFSGVSPRTPFMDVQLSARSAVGDPEEGVASSDLVKVVGQTMPRMMVGVDMNGDGRLTPFRDRFTRSDSRGHFSLWISLDPGVNMLQFDFFRRGREMVPMSEMMVVCPEKGAERPFNGSPTPRGEPFTRLLPGSVSYSASAAARPDALMISADMAEDSQAPAFSSTISLGMVFFGQFVDHDITLMKVEGQGPLPDPTRPVNIRTPALDLDAVYGLGPAQNPELYTADGLFFKLPEGENDLLRDENGRALIGDGRNDENGQIAEIHLAFQRLHNTLAREVLEGHAPAILSASQREALFRNVRRDVLGYYQGIVANTWIASLTGQLLPRSSRPLDQMPFELTAAVYRLGHTLVPDRLVVDAQGTTKSPVDASLRGPGAGIPFTLLFGPGAQPAGLLDDQIAQVMRELLIPVSPSDPGQGNMMGGHSPNLGSGHIIDGMMHLDLIETNLLRAREQQLPSGEEYLARMQNRPYDPATDGNTDLFAYILHEAAQNGNVLGPVGRDIMNRSFGGILAADPYRYDNPAVFSRQEIRVFRAASMEGLLARIGEPGF